jgi:single-strand DNA-binding protein
MNKCILMGRLCKDVEMRYTSTNNVAVANFTLAVNKRFKQEGQADADFLNCIAFGKTGEFVGKYFNKGQQVAIDGRIQTRTYENNEGKTVYVTEVVADSVYFADSKRDTNNNVNEPTPYEENADDLPF